MSTKITSASQFLDAKKSTGLIVIKCSTAWCSPCKKIAPYYEAFVKRYPSVKFYNIDTDNVPDFEDANEVTSVPTFLFIKGAWRGKDIGANIENVESVIQQYK